MSPPPTHNQPPLPPALLSTLQASHVPLVALSEACLSCASSTSDDIQGYPSGFGADLDSVMLGSVKDYSRQILVGTGKSDWAKEVTDDTARLAGMVKLAYEGGAGAKEGKGLLGKLSEKLGGGKKDKKGEAEGEVPGLFPSSAMEPTPSSEVPGVEARLSILNASFWSSTGEEGLETVVVLPDFKVVMQVPQTREGAHDLVDGYLRATVGRSGLPSPKTGLKSWPLPYHAVVLLCSHKKRDKKCAIAAPLLLAQFHHHLALHDLEGDERGEDLTDGPSIEEWDPLTRETKLEESLKGVQKNGGRVGLWKVSHIGGHRYAGNVIVYFPNGTSIWYGRVTPRDVGAVVNSMLSGKVIPELLRGGLGLVGKDGPEGVLAW